MYNYHIPDGGTGFPSIDVFATGLKFRVHFSCSGLIHGTVRVNFCIIIYYLMLTQTSMKISNDFNVLFAIFPLELVLEIYTLTLTIEIHVTVPNTSPLVHLDFAEASNMHIVSN